MKQFDVLSRINSWNKLYKDYISNVLFHAEFYCLFLNVAKFNNGAENYSLDNKIA